MGYRQTEDGRLVWVPGSAPGQIVNSSISNTAEPSQYADAASLARKGFEALQGNSNLGDGPPGTPATGLRQFLFGDDAAKDGAFSNIGQVGNLGLGILQTIQGMEAHKANMKAAKQSLALNKEKFRAGAGTNNANIARNIQRDNSVWGNAPGSAAANSLAASYNQALIDPRALG
jgi:hypothetical protein